METKEDSIENDNEWFPVNRMIYTDGSASAKIFELWELQSTPECPRVLQSSQSSKIFCWCGYKGAIGAAAVSFLNGTKMVELHYQLGPDTRHMVFEGELVGIILGLYLSWYIIGVHDHININIDNQATIKTLDNNQPQLAQYLIDRIKHNISKIHKEEKVKRVRQNAENWLEMEILFTWIAGCKGSIGNEVADEQAKQAAEFGLSNDNLLPPFLCRKLPDSLLAIKQQIANDTKQETKTWWKRSKDTSGLDLSICHSLLQNTYRPLVVSIAGKQVYWHNYKQATYPSTVIYST